MSITFNVNKKALESLSDRKLSSCSISKAFINKTKFEPEASGSNFKDVMDNSFSHGLIEAAQVSYASHYPLVLTPDVIWLTLAQGFANHVNANAEKLRKLFVSHEGKKLIMIDRDSFVKGSPDNDWPGCFSEFSDKLAEYIGKKRDLLVSNFSTTGLVEKAVSELVLMDSMKSYFKYGVRTMCGIPSITLKGSVEDWKNIRTRVENLAEYELDWWVKSLLPIMDNFVSAAEGHSDKKFWDEMYKQSGGSGGPYISGWINALFPYLEGYDGALRKNKFVEKWSDGGTFNGTTTDQFSNSLSKVPFKWQYYTVTYDMDFLGGIIGVHQHDNLSIEPAIGWAIRDAGKVTEGPINPDEDW